MKNKELKELEFDINTYKNALPDIEEMFMYLPQKEYKTWYKRLFFAQFNLELIIKNDKYRSRKYHHLWIEANKLYDYSLEIEKKATEREKLYWKIVEKDGDKNVKDN